MTGLNVTLAYSVRTSADNIETQWINAESIGIIPGEESENPLKDYCIPSDLITNYNIPTVSSTSTNGAPSSQSSIAPSTMVTIDDSNIFFLNHKDPIYDTCHVSLLHAYKTNQNNEWETLMTSEDSSQMELLIQKRRVPLPATEEPSLRRSSSNENSSEDTASSSHTSTAKKSTSVFLELYSGQDLKFQFELDQHNDYSVQEEASDENNHEAFISLYTASNESIGFVVEEEQELRLRAWIQKHLAADAIQPSVAATGAPSTNSGSVIPSSNMYAQDLHPFLNGLSIIRSKRKNSKISLHSLAIISEHSLIFTFRSLLKHALSLILSNENIEDSPQSILPELYELISSFQLSEIPSLTPLQQKIYRWTLLDYDTITYTTKMEFRGKEFKLKIPLAEHSDEITDDQVSLVKFVSKFREETMTIFNAILQERNVLFFGNAGDKQNIGTICHHVVAACLLVSPPLKNILQYRVFPYNTMKQLDNFTSTTQGYIAGTKHPDCKYKVNWDILCDLSSGKVITNPASPYYVAPPDEAKPFDAMDHGFASSMLSLIDSYALKGHKLESLEMSIRTHFQDYTRRFTNMVCSTLEYENEEEKHRALKLNEERLRTWKLTQSYLTYRQSLVSQKCCIQNINVEQLVNKLRTCESLSAEQVSDILVRFLQNIDTEETVLEFLTYFPDPQGGLYPLAVLLLHSNEKIRHMTVALLSRIDEVPEGSACLSFLNSFLMLSFDRLKKELYGHTENTG